MARISILSRVFFQALALVALPVLAQDKPPQDRPALNKDFNGNPNYRDGIGLKQVPITPHTIKRWPWGTIPENCKDINCNKYDVEVYEVTYNDVSDSTFSPGKKQPLQSVTWPMLIRGWRTVCYPTQVLPLQ